MKAGIDISRSIKAWESGFCPVTGLAIYQNENWLDREISPHYRVSFYLIGKNILFAIPKGDVNAINVTRLFQLRRKFIEHCGLKEEDAVEIRDCTWLQGFPRKEVRLAMKEQLLKSSRRCYILLNPSRIIAAVYQAGLFFSRPAYPVYFFYDYKKAMETAVKLKENDNFSSTVFPFDFGGFNGYYEVLSSSIIYGKGYGYLKESHIQPYTELMRRIYEMKNFTCKHHYRISDYSDIKGGTWKAKRALALQLKNLYAQYGKPIYSIICGANPFIVAALNLIQHILRTEFVFAKNKQQALDFINKKRHIKFKQKHFRPDTIAGYNRAVLDIIGSIMWDQPDYLLATADDSHPLKEVIDAFNIVKMDINSLLENQLLAEEKLKQSQKMEAIGQLAGGIAHDFNNMLTSIIGNTELAVLKSSESALKPHFEAVLSAAASSKELINQLLAFARKRKIDQEKISMHEILREVLKISSHTLPKNIIINEQFYATEDQVQGDRTQLENAIMNLVLNAKDAMPGGGELTVSTESSVIGQGHPFFAQLEAERVFIIKVRDTGTGMESSILAKIFDPFFTTKPYGKGSGLGLASAYGAVRSHNGCVDVESTVGQGSTFTIYLPLITLPAEEIVQETEHTGSGLILVVDDEKTVRDVVKSMLENLGYMVHVVENGREALDYYRKNQTNIALILLDIIMPEMDGYQCFKEFKKLNRQVKVIVCSGYDTHDKIEAILKEGGVAYIHKPFSLERLAEEIKGVMGL